MKVSKKIFLLSMVLLVLCLVGFESCDNCEDPTNPECKNYNPCWGIIETNAKFQIYERVGPWGGTDEEIFFPSDTVLRGTVKFEADNELDEYYWSIGNDNRIFRKKSVILSFDNAIGTIPVMLIGKKSYSECFPNDDGVDTIIKILTVIERDASPVYGKYKGFDTDKPDSTYTIQFVHYEGDNGLMDFPKGCSQSHYNPISSGFGYSTFFFTNQGYPDCYNPRGRGFLGKENRDEVTIDYIIDGDTQDDEITKKFIGKRIN